MLLGDPQTSVVGDRARRPGRRRVQRARRRDPRQRPRSARLTGSRCCSGPRSAGSATGAGRDARAESRPPSRAARRPPRQDSGSTCVPGPARRLAGSGTRHEGRHRRATIEDPDLYSHRRRLPYAYTRPRSPGWTRATVAVPGPRGTMTGVAETNTPHAPPVRKERLAAVRERLDAACRRRPRPGRGLPAGRDGSSCPRPTWRSHRPPGSAFAENRAQEAAPKGGRRWPSSARPAGRNTSSAGCSGTKVRTVLPVGDTDRVRSTRRSWPAPSTRGREARDRASRTGHYRCSSVQRGQ
ncbi:hypothetical protein HBB16_14835 [Pseudonocardia sp. MCCB 268]|nr:hypothetical protein [Pseudonocardia cytotoxica]